MWIDAICINQADNVEKSKQIMRMPEIYREALQVRVWLGEVNQFSDIGMAYIKELVGQIRLSDSIKVKEERQKVLAFIDLMRSQWFSRRWVVQEILCAKNAALHCGANHPVHWSDFILAVAKFMSRLPEIPSDTQTQGIVELRPGAVDALEAYGANALTKLDSELRRHDAAFTQQLKPLYYLISQLLPFDASDPRDTVFAMYSLVMRTQVPFPEPDYSKSVLDVLSQFVKFSIETKNSLDIICRLWTPAHPWLIVRLNYYETRRVDTILPTWIPQTRQVHLWNA